MVLRDLILNILTEEILNVFLLILITAAFIKKYFESKWLQTPYSYFCTLSKSKRFACILADTLQSELITEVFFPSRLPSFQIISFNWGDGDYYTGIHFPVLLFSSRTEWFTKYPSICLWQSWYLHFACAVFLIDRVAFEYFIKGADLILWSFTIAFLKIWINLKTDQFLAA